MFRRSQQVILLLFTIITVNVTVSMELLQEQTFERVSFKEGKLTKSILARSVQTCVVFCLQLHECRYVRFTKRSATCQLFEDVLLYYGSAATPLLSDEVDMKKVWCRKITGLG